MTGTYTNTGRTKLNLKVLIRKSKKLWCELKRVTKQFIVKVLKVFINKYVISVVEALYQEFIHSKQKGLLERCQSCGYGVRINGKVYIHDPKSMVIGNNVHIEKGCFFADAAGGLTIGDNTHINRNVTIYTTSYNYTGEALPYNHFQNPKPVSIGRNVLIGMNVCITPGVRIENGAIISLGTVVSQDVPPGAVIGSAPQRILKTRDGEYYTKLEVEEKYGGANGHILSREELNKFKQHPSEKKGNLFFVLSTGRSGTKTIAEVLSQHPEIECMHEGRPQLIRLSTELAHGVKTIEEVNRELYDIYSNTCVEGSIYGESNQKLWNLVPILNTLFPKCKFIWLIRDGRDVVASTYSRGWYSFRQQELGHPTKPDIERWYFYRLNGAACGCFAPEKWDNLSVFEKNCWYWGYINRSIEQELAKIEAERWIKICLEDIEQSMASMVSFLQTRPYQLKAMRTNVANRRLRRPDRWSIEEKKQFGHWCGEQMDKHYPGWRKGF